MEYAQIKGDEITRIPELQNYKRMSNEGLMKMDIYRYEIPSQPIYNPKTQDLGGPRLSFDGSTVTASWLVADKTLEVLQSEKKNELSNSWRNDIATIGMPVEGYDFAVDYDVNDALIWENSIDYIPESATEVEVRAIDDTFHTIPKSLFVQIPAQQKAYYAQQIQKKWTLQKAVDVATTAEEVEAISW